MNFGEDKQFWYGPANNVPGMPMDTEGKTTGVRVKGDITLSERDTLRVGAEAQQLQPGRLVAALGRRHGAQHLLEHPRWPARPL
jgi:hypothetical protein